MAKRLGRTDQTRLGERDVLLARRIMAVAELAATSGDVVVVGAVIVAACMEFLGVGAAGLLLATDAGLRQVSSCGAAAVALGALQQASGRGPAADAVDHGVAVDVSIDEATLRWPEWGREAAALGVRRVRVQPLSIVDEPVGALELDLVSDKPMDAADVEVVRIFAGLAVVMIAHAHDLQASEKRVEQLEDALRNRSTTEQAKGFLVARGCPTSVEAFEVLRRYARNNSRRVHSVAEDVLEGRLQPGQLTDE